MEAGAASLGDSGSYWPRFEEPAQPRFLAAQRLAQRAAPPVDLAFAENSDSAESASQRVASDPDWPPRPDLSPAGTAPEAAPAAATDSEVALESRVVLESRAGLDSERVLDLARRAHRVPPAAGPVELVAGPDFDRVPAAPAAPRLPLLHLGRRPELHPVRQTHHLVQCGRSAS